MTLVGVVLLGYFFYRVASTCGARARSCCSARSPEATRMAIAVIGRVHSRLGSTSRTSSTPSTTVFEGMAVTCSHFVRKPSTVQYPDRIDVRVQDTLPFRYRGILEVDLEICTGCLACERACPIDCIVIEAEKDKQTKADDPDPLRHRHREVHVLRAVQRAVPDRLDPPHAGVRGRRLLAREHGPPLREGAGHRLQAEEGPRDRSR